MTDNSPKMITIQTNTITVEINLPPIDDATCRILVERIGTSLTHHPPTTEKEAIDQLYGIVSEYVIFPPK